ncbi:SIMPL domain-containing protein [Panacibacter sp. DH6]|uniref:SIMPL domain-containing protein n=1 Tax=Panacibacter microcysteis TaxID=2793269 RepID=A0A931H007_9BACT|nr:SIMPL domain-containing protein [Panacibacter microcysteis]MBG9378462.1 SIMPL domain-containing protein [Panacibacter microcysteis]
MKKIITLVTAVVMVSHLFAQEQKPLQKTISVSGSAEAEVTPDEIYVQVDLREYNKKNGDKIDINTIRNNFLAACRSIGLTEKEVMVQSYQGYDQQYWIQKKSKKQNPDMKAAISYVVKVSSVAKLDELVDKMDDEATQNFFISKTAYSKIEELKKEMKIAAVKAAKEKATYLAAAIGEHVGQAITINDPVEIDHTPRPYYANVMMKASADGAEQAALDVDFKKMKIKFEVNVVFTLQ